MNPHSLLLTALIYTSFLEYYSHFEEIEFEPPIVLTNGGIFPIVRALSMKLEVGISVVLFVFPLWNDRQGSHIVYVCKVPAQPKKVPDP